MKRWIGLFVAAAIWLTGASAAFAANSSVPNMTAASSVAGTDLWYCVQSAGTLDRKCTSAQFAAYINSLFSQDCTVNSTGTVTCLKTNNVAFTALATTAPGTGVATALGVNVGTAGSFVVNGGALGTPSSGVATNLTGTAAGLTAGNVTTNANLTGAVTSVGNAASLGSFTSASLLAALTTKTGTGNNVFGTAPTIDSINMTTAATLAFITGSTQCLHVNTSGVVSGTGSDCGSGSGAVSSVTGGIGITVSPTTGAVVVTAPATRRDNTATTDTITSTDKGTIVTESNASAVAVAITTAGFVSTDYFTVKNIGAGLATYTPSAGTIDGNATLTVKQNQSADLYFDGTNWHTLPGRPINVACADLTNAGALCSTTPGTGVATAAAVALSGAGGLTSTIASGTATLGTSAIASGACATIVTVTATNVATTDVVSFSYNSDPTAVTGYGASATGAVLTIYPYPTSGNVNVKVCNSSSGSITPSAMTLNWRVFR